MANICYICKKDKVDYEVFINCGKYNNSIFYCEKHKPLNVKMEKIEK